MSGQPGSIGGLADPKGEEFRMKLGFIVTPKGPMASRLVEDLKTLSNSMLVVPRFYAGKRPVFLEDSIDITKGMCARIGLKTTAWKLHGIDPMSNTITICPPLIHDNGKTVIFIQDEYDRAIRDICWPVEIIECEDMNGFSAVNPTCREEIRKKMEGDSTTKSRSD
jgi:hypothetical protein